MLVEMALAKKQHCYMAAEQVAVLADLALAYDLQRRNMAKCAAALAAKALANEMNVGPSVHRTP